MKTHEEILFKPAARPAHILIVSLVTSLLCVIAEYTCGYHTNSATRTAHILIAYLVGRPIRCDSLASVIIDEGT